MQSMQRYLSSGQWRKRPNTLEEGGFLRRGTACSVQTGFFCPEAPATEKRRRKETGAPSAVGTRGREEQRKTLKRKEEQVLDSTGEQHAAEQSTLAPVPATSAREGPVGPPGTQFSHCGAHTSESGGEGTCGKASSVLPGNENVLHWKWKLAQQPRRQPLVAMTSSWSSKLSWPGFPPSAWVEGPLLAHRVFVGGLHWCGMMTI